MLPPQSTSSDRLGIFISQRGLVQRELATSLGVAHSHIGNIAAGRSEPSREFARKMLLIYGVSANWLLFGVGPMMIYPELAHGNILVAGEGPRPPTGPQNAGQKTQDIDLPAGVLTSSEMALPIWSNGKRPSWWYDAEVRKFLTNSHRKMTAANAAAVGNARFGERCPGPRSVVRYWAKLDRAFGLIRAADTS